MRLFSLLARGLGRGKYGIASIAPIQSRTELEESLDQEVNFDLTALRLR